MDPARREYHENPALGSSAVKDWRYSGPELYQSRYIKGTLPVKETPAMRLGTAVHTLVLEPHLFADNIFVAPDADRRTKKGKKELEEFEKDVPEGGTVISEDDHFRAINMRDAVFDSPVAKAIMDSATDIEKSIFWNDKGTELECKGLLDMLTPSGIYDLKTGEGLHPRSFPYVMSKRGYHLQATHYSQGLCAKTGIFPRFNFITVSSTPPYVCYVFSFDNEETRGYSYRQYAKVMREIKQFTLFGGDDWHEDSWHGVTEISLPPSVLRDEEIHTEVL